MSMKLWSWSKFSIWKHFIPYFSVRRFVQWSTNFLNVEMRPSQLHQSLRLLLHCRSRKLRRKSEYFCVMLEFIDFRLFECLQNVFSSALPITFLVLILILISLILGFSSFIVHLVLSNCKWSKKSTTATEGSTVKTTATTKKTPQSRKSVPVEIRVLPVVKKKRESKPESKLKDLNLVCAFLVIHCYVNILGSCKKSGSAYW